MKVFKVTTEHTVYIDSYEQGEGKQVNYYILDSEQKAETLKQAIENHFENTLYLPFKFEDAEPNEEKTVLFWSNLVDEDNSEPSIIEIDEWKKGEKVLYANNTVITVSEIMDLKFD